MEAFPDLASLSDSELKDLITRLETEENEISYKRRLLHGKLDILRAELVARLQQKGEGELGQVDLDRLTEILAGKTAPPEPKLEPHLLPGVRLPEPGVRALLLALRRPARHRGGARRRRLRRSRPRRSHEERSDLLEELGIEGPALVSARAAAAPASSSRWSAPQTTIGRSPDCDIFLDDVTVSRRHAIVGRGDAGFTIEDLGSLNGTFLNRSRIERGELENGDEVQIGKYRLIFLAR